MIQDLDFTLIQDARDNVTEEEFKSLLLEMYEYFSERESDSDAKGYFAENLWKFRLLGKAVYSSSHQSPEGTCSAS